MPDEIRNNPEIREGFRKSAAFKLAEHWKNKEDRGFMSFGLVQLGQIAASLGDGELAHLCLRHLVNRFWLNNLASMHNHRHLFNMDISGGQPAMIIQMLVGSAPGEIRLLPALPKEWTTGTLEGALCRGAIEITRLHWDGDRVEVDLVSKTDQKVNIILPRPIRTADPVGNATTVDIRAGRETSLSFTLQ